MATALETIITGLEALRVIGMGQQPTQAESTYCLKHLNAFIAELQGQGGSLPLVDLRISSAYTVGTRWPALRLICTTTGITITLPEYPVDGQRVEIVDAAETADTSNITVSRNGMLINGAASNYTISTEGGATKLMFRADLGDWKVMSDLALATNLPYPSDFDVPIALNAARAYTRFGQSLSAADERRADKGLARLRARYAKPPAAQVDPAVSGISGGRSGATGSLSDFLNGIDT
jgi:hypothetical protein